VIQYEDLGSGAHGAHRKFIYKRQVTLIMADLQLYAFSGKTFANLVRYG
jgi:hypothetical protein